ncbi:MAG: membrane integrity-associated transporter subunit PqiC, partial [Gammaproteobacteria bacterium]|nr:membrane integrity-associated transporter subunit PqiC [Gammaproteobacteria bacterium]
MKTRHRLALRFVAMALVASGCSSPEPRFYVLAGPVAPGKPAQAAAAGGAAIGLGPVQFPGYLDRPQIVTRSGQNELDLAEFERWAEPLKDNAVHVIADTVSQNLGGRKVVIFPWKRATPIAYQVTVDVKRFDRTRGGETELAVRWALLTADGQQELVSRDARYGEWPADDTYATTVAAMNRTLLKFSRDVTGAIRAQEGHP